MRTFREFLESEDVLEEDIRGSSTQPMSQEEANRMHDALLHRGFKHSGTSYQQGNMKNGAITKHTYTSGKTGKSIDIHVSGYHNIHKKKTNDVWQHVSKRG